MSSTNEIILTLDQKIYTKEVILRACYVFIDRAYIHLDCPTQKEIKVFLKGKKKLNEGQLDFLKGDFLNELLNVLIRKQTAAKNQKILEYIVGWAVTAALEKPGPACEITNPRTKKMEKEVEALMKELETDMEGDDRKDPLGIKKIHEEN